VTIGTIDFTTQGNIIADVAAWLVKLFKGPLKTTLQTLIGNAIKDQAATGLNKFFEGLPTYVKIPNTTLEADYMLTENPRVTTTLISADINGRVVDYKKPNTHPPIPPRIDMPRFTRSA